ncbi:hypothetical protein CCMSSC00406_0006012 [Pleurotus cornucopiae]|uniref:Uncharacterized protein n=1 Tax=Pleurotus cornucopiae TaxID=5321 RepID=A0ACB7IRI0_PLECO|nr:hypothetical protein CCMSSC00406_0006012 [Pleurotus cornucopiae]
MQQLIQPGLGDQHTHPRLSHQRRYLGKGMCPSPPHFKLSPVHPIFAYHVSIYLQTPNPSNKYLLTPTSTSSYHKVSSIPLACLAVTYHHLCTSVEVFTTNKVNVEVGDFKIRSIAQTVAGVKVRELENVDDLAASNANSSLVTQASSHERDAPSRGDDDGGNGGESSNGSHVLTAEPEEFELAEQLPDRIEVPTVTIDVVGKERKRARAPSGEMRKADMSPRAIQEMIRAKKAKRPPDSALQGEDGTKGRKRARVEGVARTIVKKTRSSRTTTQKNASAKRVNHTVADEAKEDDKSSIRLAEAIDSAKRKGTKRRRPSEAEEPSDQDGLTQQVDSDAASYLTDACKKTQVNGECTRAAKRFHQNATFAERSEVELRGSTQPSETRV